MTDEIIMLNEIIGKPITDIRCKFGMHDGWLDTAQCFIEIDRKFYIQIPHGQTDSVLVIPLDPAATTIFDDLSDIPHFHVNREGKSIAEVAKSHNARKKNIFNRLRKALFGYEPPIKEYVPYKVEYYENKLKHILNRSIVDYLWECEEVEKGYFELDNGYLISEQYMAPSGTGQAGLHYYDSLNTLKDRRGNNLNRYSTYNS
jgi:hypothetical protein